MGLMGAGGITAGVPGLADILQEDLSADYSAREAYSEPPPRASTPKQALAPARSAPPIMVLTPLTEETEADLRSTSYAHGQPGTDGQLGTGFLSTAGQGGRDSNAAALFPTQLVCVPSLSDVTASLGTL